MRGFHSQNASFTVRNVPNNALLAYKHMSQRGKDDITGEDVY
jgi:hypothetical protein